VGFSLTHKEMQQEIKEMAPKTPKIFGRTISRQKNLVLKKKLSRKIWWEFLVTKFFSDIYQGQTPSIIPHLMYLVFKDELLQEWLW
jgi:hypothetical protein